MVDVPRVPGTSSPAEPPGGKHRTDADKFKEMMKVGKTDEDQRKKKKRGEKEEDKKAEETIGEGPAGVKKRSDVELEKFQKAPKIQRASESGKEESKHQKRSEEAPPPFEAPAAPPPMRAMHAAPSEEKKEVKAEPSKYEPRPMPAEVEAEVPTPPPLPPPTPAPVQEEQPALPPIAKEEKKKEKAPEAPIITPPPAGVFAPAFLPAASPASAYSMLSAQMTAIFERMVGAIMVMQDSGIKETTIHLNTAEFAKSAFAGAQITIREFSTAPGTYNIELTANTQGVQLMQSNVAELMAAFQSGKYNFQIHRIDTKLLSSQDRPIFHRKDKPQGEEQGGEDE